jgi:deazaflavin-dependent oxidoreductase (nitroreductase family)
VIPARGEELPPPVGQNLGFAGIIDLGKGSGSEGNEGASVNVQRPVKEYKPGRWRRAENALMSALVRAGLVPSSYLLTTKGRKTGRLRSVPVTIVEHDGRRWLVAPYGPVSWVHNVRAAGRVSLRRRRDVRHYAIREVPADEAGPVLKRYIDVAPVTRKYFQADKDDPVEDFVAEADRHPVFELIPIGSDAGAA